LITALKRAVMFGEAKAVKPIEDNSYTSPDKKQAG
jgi:hypothetical protein